MPWIKFEGKFSAAHIVISERLKEERNLHGHTWKAVIELNEPEDNPITFSDLQKVLKYFDHKLIVNSKYIEKIDNTLNMITIKLPPKTPNGPNELITISKDNVITLYDEPTSENIAIELVLRILGEFPQVDTVSVDLYENENYRVGTNAEKDEKNNIIVL